MKVSKKLLRKVYGKRVEKRFIQTLKDTINLYGEEFGITTDKHLARFLAQTKHEMFIKKNGTVRLRENLNYREPVLKRFSRTFRNNPKLMANAMKLRGIEKQKYIAMNWYGKGNKARVLGNLKPIDGWKYRGSGIFQLTGRSNTIRVYKIIEDKTGIVCFNDDGDVYPSLLNSYIGGVLSAMGFWYMTKMYECKNTKCIIRKINSGLPKKEKKERLYTTISVLNKIRKYA